MGLIYNEKTGNFEENFTSDYFLMRETESTYSKEQAQQVWDNIHRKVEWLPFKCCCVLGGFFVLLTVLWFLKNGLSNMVNLYFLCCLVLGITGCIGGFIGLLLKEYVFRNKVQKYIKKHPSNVCVASLKRMLENS